MTAETIWSSSGIDPSQVQRAWTQALGEIMPGLKYSPVGSGFEASLRRRRIGQLALNYVHAMPQRVVTSARPRTAAPDKFGVIYLKSGLLRVQHYARTIEIGPGECVIIDGAAASEVITCREAESLNLSLPLGLLRQWLARPENEVAKPFTRASPLARPLLELLALLADENAVLPESDLLIMNQLAGALAIATGDSTVIGTNHSARLLNRLREGICKRFFDPGFTLQIAADEAGISRRYLVALFAQAGTTFYTELVRTRLERGAEMLRDPSFKSLSVMDISLRCGFSDASHFSKRFRARFSLSPACYRQTEMQQAMFDGSSPASWH